MLVKKACIFANFIIDPNESDSGSQTAMDINGNNIWYSKKMPNKQVKSVQKYHIDEISGTGYL